MRKVQIEIDEEVLDAVMVGALKDARDGLKNALRERKIDAGAIGIFDIDKDTDIRKIKKHLKAFDRVIDYFTV